MYFETFYIKKHLQKLRSLHSKSRTRSDYFTCDNFNEDKVKCVKPCMWTKGDTCNGVKVEKESRCPESKNLCGVCPGCNWNK